MADNCLSEVNSFWDFAIFKVEGKKEVEFGNKDILFLFV